MFCNIKKLFIYGLILTFIGNCFLSCRSIPGPDKNQVFKEIDYTEADIVSEEIKRIENFKEKDLLKALWRAWLLNDNVKDNSLVQECYNECINQAVEQYKKAVEEKDYVQARRIYTSLKNTSYSGTADLSVTEKQLNESIVKNISALTTNSKKDSTIAQCMKGTVTILVDRGIRIEKGVGYSDMVLGSGFFISKDGYLVTNHHVIESCVDPSYEGYARLYIKLSEDGETRIPAKVIGWDSILDLALLKVEIDAPFYFELGSSDDLNVGDKVYAIGSPLGLESTLTSGIISSTDRDLNMSAKVFQLDAAVNSGNSGGPLIDQKGRVQAIVFAGVQNYQGLNFAIPVEYLKNDLPFLYAGGKKIHSWIGAYGKTKRLPGSGSKNEGIIVNYVQPGSPAFLAGIRENDTILKLNDKTIYSLDQLHTDYIQLAAGTIVKITYVNSLGEEKEVPVYLEERPDTPGNSVFTHDIITSSLYPIIGVKLANVSVENKNLYLITDVLKNSVADQSGFVVGDTVQILNAEVSKDKSAIYIELYAKKRMHGNIDMGIGMQAPLDSPNYF